jgi:hypothetical protein
MSIMSEMKRIGKHLQKTSHLFKGRPKDPSEGYNAERKAIIGSYYGKIGRVGLRGKL